MKSTEFKITEEKLKILDNAEFVEIVRKKPKGDVAYLPIHRRGWRRGKMKVIYIVAVA